MTPSAPSSREDLVLTEAIEFGGEAFRLQVQVDWDELDRRRSAEGAAGCSSDVLDLMFDLPSGLAVDATELGRSAARTLRDAPAWAVEHRDGRVIRHYQPAGVVRAALAGDASAHWSEQLRAVRWITAVCPALILVEEASDAFDAMGPAAEAGVGVGLVEDDGWFELLAPAIGPVQVTPNRWLLAEQAVCSLRGCWGGALPSTLEPTNPDR